MRIIFSTIFLTLISMFYLWTMNPKENRVTNPSSLTYLSFKDKFIQKNNIEDEALIARCYIVYSSLCDMKYIKDASDEKIKSLLISMNICDLDEGILVLKGFTIVDSLGKLTIGKPRYKRG